MEGMRKFWIVVIGLVVELGGLVFVWLAKFDVGILTAFSGAVVALCGLFFNFNIKEHK
jgi:hypothetical protein